MRLDKIRFKNFKSFGPEWQEINLNEFSGELLLLVGKNGFGKSSIAHAIIFALYGKNPTGVLDDLPNRDHDKKSMKVELTLNSYGKEILIRRSRYSFDIFIDGVEYEQAGKSSMQEYLEREFYDIPYHAFKNLLILSVNDFKSFLDMSPSDKRKIRDKIFGFSIINQMREINKSYLNDAKNSKIEYGNKISQLEKNIEQTNRQIKDIVGQIEEEDNQKISEIRNSISDLNNNINNFKDKFNQLQEHKNKINSKLLKIENNLTSIKHEYQTIQKKLKLYDNSQCPTCQSNLDTEFHQEIQHELENRDTKLEQEIDQQQSNYNSLNQKKIKVDEKLQKLNRKITSTNTQVKQLQHQLNELESTENSKSKIDNFEQIINTLKDDKESLKKKERREQNKYNFYNVSEQILSDGGIKKLAIRKIIPNLNRMIKEKIQDLHLKYNIQFDEDFNAVMYHIDQEISVASLSTGERKKYDLAILVSIIKLIKTKYRSINLLFLDEIFSSVDADGRYEILQILKEMSEDLGMTTIVMNHSELPIQFFSNSIQIYKGSYSTIEIKNL